MFAAAMLPSLIQSFGLIMIALFNQKTASAVNSSISDIAWILAFSCLPILSAVTGLAIAILLSVVIQHWPKWRLKAYSICFMSIWIIVFGYLSFFTFVMGFGAFPVVNTMEKFFNRLIMVFIQFPISIGISIVVCVLATAVASTVIKPIDDKTNIR